MVVLARAGQTNSATTLDLLLPTSGDGPSYTGPWWSDATARAGYAMTTMTVYCVLLLVTLCICNVTAITVMYDDIVWVAVCLYLMSNEYNDDDHRVQ